MGRFIGRIAFAVAVACWCVVANASDVAGEPATQAAAHSPATGPILVGHAAPLPTAAGANVQHAAQEALPSPVAKLLPGTAGSAPHAAPPITDVIMLIDATQEMALPIGRERRIAIAQWAALDIADGVPENIPAAFVALHDEATALRQLLPLTPDGRGHLRRTVMRLTARGRGKLDLLLFEADRLLKTKPDAVPLVVFVTDGLDCDPSSQGATLQNLSDRYPGRFYFQMIDVGDHPLATARLRQFTNYAGKYGEMSSVRSHAELPTALSRCRQLFEQITADRAARAKRQAADLAHCRTERTALQQQVDSLNAVNGRLEKELNAALAKNSELALAVKDLTRERNELADQVVALTGEKEALQRDNATLTTDNQRLALEKAKLTEESANRLATIERLTAEKHTVELSRDGYRRAYWTWLVLALSFLALLIIATLLWWFRTIRLLDRLAAVTKERDDWRSDHAGHSVKLEEANEEIRCLQHKLAECRDRAGDLQSELDHARDDVERLGDEKRHLKCDLEESETRRHELTRELDRCKDECGDLGREQTTLKAEYEELSDRCKRLKRKCEELEQRAAASHQEVDQTRQSLHECRTQAGRLEERLDACHQSKGDKDRRIHELEHLVNSSRDEAQRLSEKLRCCHDRSEQHAKELCQASTAGAAAESRAQQLERALHDCQRNALHTSATAATARAEQQAAFAATLGATREMAINGRHHGNCCSSQAASPVVVAHNTPSHSTVTTPNGPVVAPTSNSMPVVTPSTIAGGYSPAGAPYGMLDGNAITRAKGDCGCKSASPVVIDSTVPVTTPKQPTDTPQTQTGPGQRTDIPTKPVDPLDPVVPPPPPQTEICKEIILGSINGVPEFKVDMEKQCKFGICIKVPVGYTRNSKVVALAKVCGPADIVESALEDIKQCAIAAAGAATVASIATSPAAALPAFEASFKPCLVAKLQDEALKIKVSLKVDQQSGEWRRRT